MKSEIDVNDRADIKAIMNVLAGGGASTEDSVERTEKFLAAAAEDETPKKRGPGRPRMTDEEKAEAARKRAEAKKQKEAEEAAAAAAAAAAADEDEDEEDDEPADKGRALALDDSEDDADSDASDSDEDDSDDADPMEKAVALATQYLRDGNGKEVRRALKEVGASRVSDLKGKKVQEFLDLIESI